MLRLLAAIAFILLTPLASAGTKVIVVDMDTVIHPITVEILDRALIQAGEEDAGLVLIRLNTPGGLLDATREIVEKIVASEVPVVTYVTPSGGRAASAGFFILVAGDVAAMAPGTNTGAASPVLMGQQMDPVMRRKAFSIATTWPVLEFDAGNSHACSALAVVRYSLKTFARRFVIGCSREPALALGMKITCL